MFGLFRKKPVSFSELNINADYHCHLLPGVDDGVQLFDESVSILRLMQQQGYKTVHLTPHIDSDSNRGVDEPFLKGKFREFTAALPDDITLDISLAAEYMVNQDFEDRIDSAPLLCTEKKEVLIEMSYYYASPNMDQAVFTLNMAGYNPVVAHPERYRYLVNNLSFFDKLRDMGCKFQLNLLSLSGVYGKSSMIILNYLLDGGYYDYVGTDTHTLNHFERIVGMQLDRKLVDRLRAHNLIKQ